MSLPGGVHGQSLLLVIPLRSLACRFVAGGGRGCSSGPRGPGSGVTDAVASGYNWRRGEHPAYVTSEGFLMPNGQDTAVIMHPPYPETR